MLYAIRDKTSLQTVGPVQTPFSPGRASDTQPRLCVSMKLPRIIFVAGLVLASSLAARAEISAQGLLESYYLDPQPGEIPHMFKELSRRGYFEQPGHVAIAIGFFSTVFAQHPERVDEWLLGLNGLPPSHNRLVASALWQAGNPLGTQMMRTLSRSAPNQADVEQLISRPVTSVLDTVVLSPSSMNLQWGAFLASGDERHIIAILDAIGTDRPGLDTAARYALAQEAAAHPRVFEICRAQLDKQPNEVRAVLRAALNEAASDTGRPGI